MAMDRLTGIHAVREALEAGRAFDRIVIARGRQDTRVSRLRVPRSWSIGMVRRGVRRGPAAPVLCSTNCTA